MTGAHSVTVVPLVKLIFRSFYAPITIDECHAWFHLNAASPAARNMEQAKINPKNLVHSRIRTLNTARYPAYKSTALKGLVHDWGQSLFAKMILHVILI